MGKNSRDRTKPDRRLAPEAPLSTYRVQLSDDVTFDEIAREITYFADLGIDCLYLSPILEAAPGSTHFYDVVDHSTVSERLGGVEGLRRLSNAARAHGIGLIADIVPNHMAVPTPAYSNKALWSVLRDGEASTHAHWFDVDWGGTEQVLMAVLGDRIGQVLARGEITVEQMLVPGFEHEGLSPVLRYYEHVFPVRPGTENLPIEALLDAQPYRLAYWRVGNEELNYRRFFDVRTLVGLRVEDLSVFEATHQLMIDLVNDGTLMGLRVDHPDGLADPTTYVNRLVEATHGAWIVVEKILESDERLPGTWKVAGTTGYDALWRIDAVLRDPAGAAPLASTMHRVASDALGELPNLVREAKELIVTDSLHAEIRRLASLAHAVCHADIRLRDHSWKAIHDCLCALVVAFGRYRAYILPNSPALPACLDAIDHAAQGAARLLDGERHDTLTVVVDLVKGKEVGSAGRTSEAPRLEFVQRFQQVCGAVMAKGVEDTAYYRWTHLLPLCEVGSPAERFAIGPDEFHAWCVDRQVTSPTTMNVLTTHDTKRSGDMRARLGVLSEMGEAWSSWIDKAQQATAAIRPWELDGRTENMWWQVLVGSVDESGQPMEWDRLEGFLIKAMREAKQHTSWTDPQGEYESAVLWFAQSTYRDPAVTQLVAEWTDATHDAVQASVLGHTLLHLTMPGVPDVYQGTERFRALLVDPDNRRSVDFSDMHSHLLELKAGAWPDGLSDQKHLLTVAALAARGSEEDAFRGSHAGYSPLSTTSGNAIAFARTADGDARTVTVVTRTATELARLGGWRDHVINLPPGTWRDSLSHERWEGTVGLAKLLAHSPVSLLVRDS